MLRRLASGVALPEVEGRTALLRGVQRLEHALGGEALSAVERALAPVGHRDALEGLGPRETLLAFAWLERAVVVLRIDQHSCIERVAVVPAGEAGTLIERVRESARSHASLDFGAVSALLERLIPQSLCEGSGCERPIVVPDGAAALVPWGAMLNRHRAERGLPSIEVVQSTSVRRFVTARRNVARAQYGPSLIMGAPPSARRASPRTTAATEDPSSTAHLHRPRTDRGSRRFQFPASSTPMTRRTPRSVP